MIDYNFTSSLHPDCTFCLEYFQLATIPSFPASTNECSVPPIFSGDDLFCWIASNSGRIASKKSAYASPKSPLTTTTSKSVGSFSTLNDREFKFNLFNKFLPAWRSSLACFNRLAIESSVSVPRCRSRFSYEKWL